MDPTDRPSTGGNDRVPVSQQAVASVVCSALLLCPLTSVAGIFLGLRALRAIRLSTGLLGGARLARTGVVLGSLSLIVQFVGLSTLARMTADKAEAAASRGIRLTFVDPPAALADAWTREAARRMDTGQLQDVVDRLVVRHGGFERVAVTTPFDQTEARTGRWETGVAVFFEDKTVFGRVIVDMWPFSDARLIELKLGDEEVGDIVLPPVNTPEGE